MRALLLLLLLGCTGTIDESVEDPVENSFLADERLKEGTPEAAGVLRVANELSQADLVGAVGISTRAAKGIVAGRPFATLAALDAVPYVGTRTFQRLLDYARAHGYIASGVQTVFLILMENHSWSSIAGSSSAPYINSLLPMAAYARAYYNPPGLHPSEPNYLWLEGGQDFGVTDDADPATNHIAGHDHLAYLLDEAGVSWRSYQEDISGAGCPTRSSGLYAAKHNPFVFFDDETGAGCEAHNRPYAELAGDLASGAVARYNFITPNLCHDMHDSCAPTSNRVRQGDDWLAAAVPPILASRAYQDGGALLITWDEAASGDGPIGMIVLSPLGKGGGYSNSVRYSHSSTLRTLEEIFGVAPMLGDAANATDLADLFTVAP